MKLHTLPPLPFSENSLEPAISKETVHVHYEKHHRGYVDKLNKLISGTSWESQSLEEIVRGSFQKEMKIFNQAAQVWNHNFYWQSLTPPKAGKNQGPDGDLKNAINGAWGSFSDFQKQFSEVAAGLFGSGWAWLVSDSAGGVRIEATSNADNPLRKGQIALLTVDVWEHAYYIDYRNERAKYLETVWSVLNWQFAAQNFERREQIAAA